MIEERVPNLIPSRYLETLVARLQQKADWLDVKLPTDAALYIAQSLRSNARAMEDALTRLIAYSSLIGTEISLVSTQMVLKSFIEEQRREVALDFLPELTSPRFGTKKAEVRFRSPMAAGKESVLCMLEGRDGRKTRRVRHELEVNMRESERERLARQDAYERELERRAKKQRQG
jgi:Bacterial dnaA  protein